MDVSRSNLYGRLKGKEEPEFSREETEENKDLLVEIKRILKERPTYGYPRVTAMINKARISAEKPTFNEKRIYRIMRENKLTLVRFPCKDTQTHDGKIMTMKSNMRWCSDIFGIQCWNGDLVWVVFILDCHDREIIAYSASTVGVDGELVRDTLTEAVEKRFGRVLKIPNRIDFLTDRGPQFTAKETVYFGGSLGFNICTTPAYSPESNGMAEAFVKTMKRDYVYVNDLSTKEKVLEQLPGWFEDYNENAPHSALKMMAPREYIRAKSAG